MSEVTTATTGRRVDETKNRLSPNEGGGLVSRLLSQGAKDWKTSEGTVSLICSGPVILVIFSAICALIGKDAYKWWTGEDQFGEYLQVIFWTIGLGLALLVVKNRMRAGDNIFALLYFILCIGVFFVIGEEISWGQRIFGWMTPEAIKEINKQEETNLHNIHGIGDMFKWLHLLVGACGTFLPIIAMKESLFARYRDKVKMLIPHYTLVPYFAFIFVWRAYRNLFEAPKEYYFAISEFSEVTELALSLAFALFVWFQIRHLQPDPKPSASGLEHSSKNKFNGN